MNVFLKIKNQILQIISKFWPLPWSWKSPKKSRFLALHGMVPLPKILNYPLFRLLIKRATYFQQKRINVLRDLHKGEHCYIIGDGVSLKYFDLRFFKDLPAIITAKIPLHSQIRELNARYWVLPEPIFFWPTPWTPYSRTNRVLHSPYRVRRMGIQPIMHATNFPFTLGTNSFFIFDDFLDGNLDDSFITRQTKGFSGSFTAAISTAIYLGFTKAHLVGFDYTHSPSRNGHWYEDGPGDLANHNNYNHEYIEKAQRSIELITVTLDGTSHVLPSISYYELTGDFPQQRSNHDLISQTNLRLLRKMPFYNL